MSQPGGPAGLHVGLAGRRAGPAPAPGTGTRAPAPGHLLRTVRKYRRGAVVRPSGGTAGPAAPLCQPAGSPQRGAPPPPVRSGAGAVAAVLLAAPVLPAGCSPQAAAASGPAQPGCAQGQRRRARPRPGGHPRSPGGAAAGAGERRTRPPGPGGWWRGAGAGGGKALAAGVSGRRFRARQPAFRRFFRSRQERSRSVRS